MSKQALTTIATRHQVFLERLKTQTATDFSSVLPKLGNAIAEITSKLEVESMSRLTKKQLLNVLIDLKLKQTELIGAANKQLVDNLKELNKYETDFEARALEGAFAAGGAKKITLSTPSTAAAWKRIMEQPLSATGQLMEPFINGWGESQIAGVNQAVMKAWGEGRTVSQLMRDIRGTKALNYQDGIAAVSRRQAEAIARTSVQHVAQQARMATWEENADLVIGYTFIATLDGRTTSKCRSLDGQTFEMGKGPVPPVHVNCRSTTIPKLPKEFDFLDEGATRSSKDGYVPANQSYYDWLKGQPESFQDEVLGPSRAKLFREGGLTSEKFAALNLGKNFEPLTLAQMQLKEPQIFEKTGVVVKKPIVGPDLSGEARAAEARAKKPTSYKEVIRPDQSPERRLAAYRIATGNQPELSIDWVDLDGPYAALQTYKGSDYRNINGLLRGTKNESSFDPSELAIVKNKIKSLDKLMTESRLNQDVYLYRGFDPPKGFDFEAMSDFTFKDLGFVSTSFDRSVALEDFRTGVAFKIRAPKGTNGIAVESRLGDGSGPEAEVLLPRGTTFRFTGLKTKIRGSTIYEVEIVED